jgi:hypothetical protein
MPAVSLDQEEDMGNAVALTENYIHARIGSPAVEPNRLIEIRIDSVKMDETLASVVRLV